MSFPTTRWTMVDMLKGGDEAKRHALGEIATVYGPPLFTFALHGSHGARTPQDCEDLVNDFFLRCTERRLLELADPEKGRFRTFVVTSFKHLLSNDTRFRDAKKRKPKGGFVSLESLTEAFGSALEPRTGETAHEAFQRMLRKSLLRSVLAKFRGRCQARGDELTWRLFFLREIQPPRNGTPVPTFKALAEEHGVASENAANKMVLAAKEEFRELVRERIERDTESAEEAEIECSLVLGAIAL
jgi:hypothetical protein